MPASSLTAATPLLDVDEETISGRQWPIVVPAIVLGAAGTVVQAVSPLVPALETPLALLLLAGISALGLVAAARTRRADWWLATLIVILSMFPNSSVNPDLRIVAGGFRLFTRLVLGALSPWDVLLLILLILALWMRPRGLRTSRGFGRSADVFLLGLGVVVGAGVANGFIHALILNYGPTSLRSVVQQSLPIYYLFACILIGRLAIVDSQSLRKILWAVRLSSAAVLIQGAVLLFLSFREQFTSLRGFMGIPIILYDQLTILNVFVCLAVARYSSGLKLSRGDKVMAAGGVLFLLMSTRRLVLIMLLFNVCIVFALAVRRGQVVRSMLRMARGAVAVAAIILAAASVTAPTLVQAIGQVIRSIDLTSEIGQTQMAGGALRVAELQNMYLNLGSGLTPAWVFGRGIGTYWQEYVPTELALDVGSAAFVESQLVAGAQGWWPGFHLPFVSVVYRFGMLGGVAIWALVMGWFLRWRAFIRGLSEDDRAFAVTVVVLMVVQLLQMGDSLDSAGPSLQGCLVAGLWGFRMRRAGPPGERPTEVAEPT
jgi:hypothetical protein